MLVVVARRAAIRGVAFAVDMLRDIHPTSPSCSCR